ncbi:MAG TPA: glutamate--tRNA ligase, partial [Pseudolabrys sp.]|nr:glutamate--tRNA ligase [Pseudolabrys sp.]
SRFLWTSRPLDINDQAKTLLTPEAKTLIAALLPELEAVADWNAASAEAVVRPYAERAGLKLGAVAQPLRAALTGRTTSPPIFDVLAVLGRDESLARLRDQAAL